VSASRSALPSQPRLRFAISTGAFMCSLGQDACAELCLQHGADVNAQNSFGATPLIHCATAGKTVGATMELRARPDGSGHIHTGTSPPCDVCTGTGLTPATSASGLSSACRMLFFAGHLNCCVLCLKHGARLNERTSEGNTALVYAARWGRIDVVQVCDLADPACK
jgi:ankyrin repeat protein